MKYVKGWELSIIKKKTFKGVGVQNVIMSIQNNFVSMVMIIVFNSIIALYTSSSTIVIFTSSPPKN